MPTLTELIELVDHAREDVYGNKLSDCLPDCTACALLAKVREIQDEAQKWRLDDKLPCGAYKSATDCADSLLALVGEGKL